MQTFAAGLPNITGNLGRPVFRNGTSKRINGFASVSGAFQAANKTEQVAYTTDATSNTSYPCDVNFNAAASNSIYGKSQTVQPPALSLIPQIKF